MWRCPRRWSTSCARRPGSWPTPSRPAETILTPAEAAQLLGLSRPFVVRLLDDGEIPSERLPGSRHRRVRLSDVLAFSARREQRREGRLPNPSRKLRPPRRPYARQ
ncbi:MAG: excisionase family DNA-binding protein [Acidimicrobiales bacterium]